MRIACFFWIGSMLGLLLAGCSNAEPQWAVDAGALKLRVTDDPWNMMFFDAAGNEILVELPAVDDSPTGSLGMHLGPPPPGNGQLPSLPPALSQTPVPPVPPQRDSGWVHATAVESSKLEGETYTAKIATSDPARKLELVATAQGDGVIEVNVTPATSEGGPGNEHRLRRRGAGTFRRLRGA